MGDNNLEQLQAVNSEINKIPYDALPGKDEPVDWWTDVPVVGNSFTCRDYVLVKSKRLAELGWTSAQMTVLLLWTEPVAPPPNDRQYHAVLCVDVDGDTWVLDSRFDQIYRYAEPPVDYRYDRRQIPGTTGFAAV